ncbi:MAG TPA: hypothetical protein VFC78_11920 [Tepidisphaeraceae bacterium]|nr:hypothetical protein [Tepidisphaeraceae bacterium]
MNPPRPRPVFPRDARAMEVRRRVDQQDLSLFEAIAGKQPEYDEAVLAVYHAKAAVQAPELAERRRPHRTSSLASLKLSLRLREWCEQGANRVSRPIVADWLRHVSDEAFTRLEQAQARLSAARPRVPANVRAVEAPPITPNITAHPHPYMRVA